MSLELTLMFFDPKDLKAGTVQVGDALSFDDDRRIVYQIFRQNPDGAGYNPAIQPKLLPPRMWIKDLSYGRTRKNSYGPLNFVYASELKTLVVPSDTTQKNKAIKVYIDALPDDTPIILWTH